MNKDDLKKLGLTDEAVMDQIIVLHGKDIEKHKTEAGTAKTEADGLRAQLAEANKQIEAFKAMPKVEDIQKAADEWKAKAEKAQADATTQMAQLKFDHALDAALTGAKAKSPKAVKALLNLEPLKLQEDGSIFGLKEQLETIQKDNDYLFEAPDGTPRIVTGGNNKNVITDSVVAAARQAAGLPPPK